MAVLAVAALLFGATGGRPASVAEAAVIGGPGTTVTISGANFTATTAVMFGWPGQEVVIPTTPKCTTTGTGCLVSQTATALVVKAPSQFPFDPGEPWGFYPITVCTNGASASTCGESAVSGIAKINGFPPFPSGFVYGPAVTKMTPLAGGAGAVVTLAGAKFGTTSTPLVRFLDANTFATAAEFGGPGEAKCATTTQTGCIKSFSDTSIIFVAPTGIPAARYIVDVLSINGPATFLLPPYFSYGKPAVFSSSPVGGPAGALITIKGKSFGTGTPAIVRFHGIGPGGAPVDVSAACSATLLVGCFSAPHTADSIMVKAPAMDPAGFPFASMEVLISGAAADDMSHGPTTFGQSALRFDYGPVIVGSTGLLHAKPGTSLAIKGANFGPMAGVQLGESTFIVNKCSTTVTHTCIVSSSDTSISVKPPPTLSGEHMVSVVTARLVAEAPFFYAQTVWANGGFRMSWSTGPVVTNIS